MKKNSYSRICRYKKHFYSLPVCVFFITIILLSLLPTVSAGGQDATFDSVEVKAIPPMQGVGGDIKIEASANFFGGCCYHLYAKDVKAELNVLNAPEKVQITSPLPSTIGSVDAVPGGKATSAKFEWTVASDVPGTYTIQVQVSSSNCGSQTSECEITVVEGASISEPTIFPSKPSVREPITFSAEVRSGNEFVGIDATTLYIWHSTEDYSFEDLKAEESRLYEINVDNVDHEDNKQNNTSNNTNTDTSGRYIGTGSMFQMSHVDFTESWRVRVNDFKKEENIYYWYKIETNDGKNTTSMVYKLKIEDLEKKYQMLNNMIWGTIFIITLGVILILGISWKYLDRTAVKIGKTGVYILGSETYSKPMKGKRVNIHPFSIERYRVYILFFLMIIIIIFLIISIQQGLFQELLKETGG